MGKALIKAHRGDGLYDIEIQVEHSRAVARVAYLNERITTLNEKLTTATAEQNTAKVALDLAVLALNDYIENTDPDAIANNPSDLNALTKKAFEEKSIYSVSTQSVKVIKLELAAVKKEQAYLKKYCPEKIETTAWCLDYSTNLTGTVAIAEVDYRAEKSSDYYILPGNWQPFKTAINDRTHRLSNYDADRDGILQSPGSSNEWATWFNLCMLPGLRKTLPRYYVGTYVSMNDGLYNVLVDSIDANFFVTIGRDSQLLTGLRYWTGNVCELKIGDRVMVARAQAIPWHTKVIGSGIAEGDLYIIGPAGHPRRPEDRLEVFQKPVDQAFTTTAQFVLTYDPTPARREPSYTFSALDGVTNAFTFTYNDGVSVDESGIVHLSAKTWGANAPSSFTLEGSYLSSRTYTYIEEDYQSNVENHFSTYQRFCVVKSYEWLNGGNVTGADGYLIQTFNWVAQCE